MAENENVTAVRRFSRFYTRRLGLLHEGLLSSPFSLTEGRLIYEIAQRRSTTARELATDLDLDSGYLSRILQGFGDKGLIARRSSETDRRQVLLSLTEAGRAAFGAIDRRSCQEVQALLDRLSPSDQQRLAEALGQAEDLMMSGTEARRGACILRSPRPGDYGWVVHRHGALYAQEYGWDETFEALVAEIVAPFARSHDSQREACWIADQDGVVGSVFLVRSDDETAKLRLLYVEPRVRGSGIGRTLVDTCIGFARKAGYRRLTLWTNDVLVAARRIYQNAGFRLIGSEPHHSFGHDLVGEQWELTLRT